jgi:Protein of unknown function (DUF 659)
MPATESPVWQYVTKDPVVASAGNQIASCNGCGKTATTSPKQWFEHLLKCDGSNDPEAAEHAKAAAAKHFRQQTEVAERKSSLTSSRLKQTSLVKLGQKQLNEEADAAFARWAFATGQPLLAVDDYFFREALNKVAAAGASRKHVGRKRLKEQLLPAEKKRLKKERQDITDLNKELYGQSVVSDGWTDANRRPLINILLVSPAGEMFQEAIDTSGNTKSMQYIADQVGKHINSNVDFVVMDGACSGAIELLTERHPWLSGVVCTTHSLDLLMEDLGKMAFAAGPVAAAKDLVQFINNHQKPRAMFMKVSDVCLLSPSNTRFGYNLIMLERVLRCEDSIRSVLSSRDFKEWRRDQKTDLREHAMYAPA